MINGCGDLNAELEQIVKLSENFNIWYVKRAEMANNVGQIYTCIQFLKTFTFSRYECALSLKITRTALIIKTKTLCRYASKL